MNNQFIFSKKQTEYIKGIAILLMLVHHFFGFPEWYVEGISYIGIPLRVNTLEYALGQFSQICVSIFAFVTGFGMFFSYKSGNIVKKSLKKLISFMIGYWLVLFGIALPINMLIGKTDLTLSFILKNAFSIKPELVSFAWYVRFYILLIFSLPIFYKLMSKYAAITLPLFFISPAICNIFISKIASTNPLIITGTYLISEYFFWITCALSGLCFAKYGLFNKINNLFTKLKQYKIPLCIVLLAVLTYSRTYFAHRIGAIFTFDCLYAPFIIYLLCSIIDGLPDILGKVLTLLGKHSVNLWFLHSFFFFRTASLMKYAFWPKVSILIIVWVILLLMPISVLLNKLQKLIINSIWRTPKSKPESTDNSKEKVFQNV